MKSRISRLAKLMSIGIFGFTLLSAGAKPASADGVDFPTTICRAGYTTVGRLCISNVKNPATRLDAAIRVCRNSFGRVATYGDLFYLYKASPGLAATYSPNGSWLGSDWVSDDLVLCGNKDITSGTDGDISNFEGYCDKGDSKTYWCAHSRE